MTLSEITLIQKQKHHMLSFVYIYFTRNTHRAQEITKVLWRRTFKEVEIEGTSIKC